MESKKTTSIYAITDNKIDSLRAFINLSKEMYHSKKNDLNNNDFLEWLKRSCFQIEEEIENTIDYYQLKENEASFKTIEKAKDKCKDLSILLNKYKLELLSFGFGANEYSIYKKELKDAFDFELSNEKKDLIDNHLEIKREFLSSINNFDFKETIKQKSIKDKTKENWFIVGVKFATGEIQEMLIQNQPPKVAEILGNKDGFRPYITSTIGIIKKDIKSKDKNIYTRKKEDINLILNYCKENNLIVCQDFKDKIKLTQID